MRSYAVLQEELFCATLDDEAVPTMIDDQKAMTVQHGIAIAELKVHQADDQFVATHHGESCKLCNSGPDIAFSMAFQPIVDAARQGDGV